MLNINKVVKELVTESLFQQKDVLKRLSQHKEMLKKQFLVDCLKELKIKTLPKVIFTKNKSKTETLGHNDLTNNEIVIFTRGRNMSDAFRTLAHELKHSEQFSTGEVTLENANIAGKTGSPQENSATNFGGIMLRNFGKKFPEIYELSFDNDLNERGNFEKYQSLLKVQHPIFPSDIYDKADRQIMNNKTYFNKGNVSKYNNILTNDRSKVLKEKEDFGFRTGHIEGNKPEDMQRMDSNRSTGHFGTGYYFFGDEDSARDYQKGSGGRDIRIVDFSKYNLLKIPSKEFGFRLHDFFKKLNNNDFINSGRIKSSNLITYDNISNYLKNNSVEFNLYGLRELLEYKDYLESYLYDFDKNVLIKYFSSPYLDINSKTLDVLSPP